MARKGSITKAKLTEDAIIILRGQRVLLDRDLARLYGVEVRALVQAVKRNIERFPEDFIFELTSQESEFLRSQIVILKKGRGRHSKYSPYAFTEQGVAMLSSVLRSKRAVQVNIEIMRTFVRLRHLLASNTTLAKKLRELEKKYDAQFRIVFEAIHELMSLPKSTNRQIGFRRDS